MNMSRLRLSPLKVQSHNLRRFDRVEDARMALLFVQLCQAEAERTGADVWVGFAWMAFVAKGYELVGVDPALTSACWVRSGVHALFETNCLSSPITPGLSNILF